MSVFLSPESLLRTHILLAMGLAYMVFAYWRMRSKGLTIPDFACLPSFAITALTVMIWCTPVYVGSIATDFIVPHLRRAFYDEAQRLILWSSFALFLGMLVAGLVFGKDRADDPPPERPMDFPLGHDLVQSAPLLLTIAALFMFPFCIAFRFDLILGGGLRRIELNSGFLGAMIPLGQIMMTIFTLLAGIYYGYYRRLIILPVLLDLLQLMAKLSRAFFLPVALFVISAHLSGRRFSTKVLVLGLVGGMALSTVTLLTRGVAQRAGGEMSLAAGLEVLEGNPVDGIADVVQANTIAGLLSVAVRYTPRDSEPVGQLIIFIQSILPIPSFLGMTPEYLDLSKMLGTTHASLPMMSLGEVYYRFGMWGSIVYFLFGFLMGWMEAGMVRHLQHFGRTYWPHLLIYLSLLYGYILTFHSPWRRATRFALYSLAIILIVKFVFGKVGAAKSRRVASGSAGLRPSLGGSRG